MADPTFLGPMGSILAELRKKDGFLPLHDKSSSEDIKRAPGDSKKSFKSAIDLLYKQGMIKIEIDGIRLEEKKAAPIKPHT